MTCPTSLPALATFSTPKIHGPIMVKVPRSLHLLKLLKDCSAGLRLDQMVIALGVPGRKAQSATVSTLLDLRQKGRAQYESRPSTSKLRGGIYKATEAGTAYLAAKLQAHPEWAEELGESQIIETGAMRGESPQVFRVSAASLPIPQRTIPNWVFDLAQRTVQGPPMEMSL